MKPLKDTPIQRGIVQPDFGQPGGGVEVLFGDGTAASTVTGPDDPLPEKQSMTVKLAGKWVDYLIRQPESGMGFQKVDVRLKGNRVLHNVPVFNAEEIDLPEDCAALPIEEIQLHED